MARFHSFLVVSATNLLLLLSTIIPTAVQPLSTLSWVPCSIHFDHVSQQYPVTLWRKLTSSEPRREFAIENINLSLNSNAFVLLVGASSSGKSTILKLILGTEEPISGSVRILIDDKNSSTRPAIPVLLDQRPVYSNQPHSVKKLLTNKAMGAVSCRLGSTRTRVENLIDDVSNILELALNDKKGYDLSPSEAYLCSIAEACLQSMLHNYEDSNDRLAAPILLLDEWMDTETSTVIRKVQSSLLKLVDRGAIVLSITHKPDLHKIEEDSTRCITLNRGKILSST